MILFATLIINNQYSIIDNHRIKEKCSQFYCSKTFPILCVGLSHSSMHRYNCVRGRIVGLRCVLRVTFDDLFSLSTYMN